MIHNCRGDDVCVWVGAARVDLKHNLLQMHISIYANVPERITLIKTMRHHVVVT